MKYYYLRHGHDVQALLRCDDDGYQVERWKGGETWVPSTFTLPELQGAGGSTDFDLIDEEEADSFMAGEGPVPTLWELAGSDELGGMPNEGDGGIGADDAEGVEPDLPDIEADVEVVKSDTKNMVFGWASVTQKDGVSLEDRQGDLIEIADLEDAAYDFNITSRTTGDMHQSESFGELVESFVVTQDKVEQGWPEEFLGRWWVGFKVPPEYHEQVRNGSRTMFSIEGTAKREPV